MGCLSCWDRWYCLGPTCYHTDKLSCQRGCYFWTKGGSAGPGLLPARTGTGLVPLTITWGHEPAPGSGRGAAGGGRQGRMFKACCTGPRQGFGNRYRLPSDPDSWNCLQEGRSVLCPPDRVHEIKLFRSHGPFGFLARTHVPYIAVALS